MKDPLLERLEAFGIGRADAPLSFGRRLARENRWSTAFAERVLREYRRFLFLAMRAGHPVTPSEAVDQAWHLHLCYTRSYWHDLCRDTLGKELHHGPTEGGTAEDRKFHDWYERTLESYRRLIGEEPPVDIWPPARERFAADSRWVDARRHWIVRKPDTRRVLRTGAAVSLLAATAGCGGLAMDGALVSADCFLIFMGVIVVAIILGVIRSGGGKGGRGGRGGGSGCGGGGWFFGSGCGSSGDSGCGGGGCGGGGGD